MDALIRDVRPAAVGIASAYVTAPGVEGVAQSLKRYGASTCRLIAGTDGFVTQPGAIELAIRNGWTVRFGAHVRSGIFHPKLMVLGNRFGPTGCLQRASGFYIGSGNLTTQGLYSNLELGVVGTSGTVANEAAAAFGELWTASRPVTKGNLATYAARFADEARRRRPQELRDFGIEGSGSDQPPSIA
ncbi:MAG: phospholipase D-like domain-containing protein, partial [Nitrososphaerales archaeon]